MPAHDPQPGSTTDLLLVIGVAAIVMGLGSLILGLSVANPIANSPRVGIEAATTRAADVALNRFAPSGQRANRDPGRPPIATARYQTTMNGTEAGAARTYLLEMSARLRRATLGADQATRDAVNADFPYAYAWLGLGDSAPERAATLMPRHHVTPPAIGHFGTLAWVNRLAGPDAVGNFTRGKDGEHR